MDEACGLRKKDETIVPTQLQEGTAEVASWNKQVYTGIYTCIYCIILYTVGSYYKAYSTGLK